MARFDGTAGDDSLDGSLAADEIFGLAGDDTLNGLDGDDLLYGGDGHDLIATGPGDDQAWGGAGDDTIRGDKGNQTLHGGDGDDMVLLAVEAIGFQTEFDPVFRHEGYGGAGDDLIQFIRDTDVALYGGTGVDTVRYVGYSAMFDTMTLTVQGPGAGFTTGSGRSGTFRGMERLEFFADYGDQDVTGGDLADQIHVGAGNDRVMAGLGDDTVGYRSYGTHTLDGGEGRDTLVLEGGIGVPVYFVVRGDGTVDDGMLSEISGFELYHVFGQGRADDHISLGDGNDTGEGFAGNDVLFGRRGADQLRGGSGDDQLFGGNGADRLRGGAGDDLLHGGRGNDRIFAGTGADTVRGGQGNDQLFAGTDAAVLYGGAGSDSFILSAAAGAASLAADFTSGEDRVLVPVARLAGFQGTAGELAAADLAFGAADRAGGQFVLTSDTTANETVLWWDSDGISGETPLVALLRFAGTDTLPGAGDILLV